MRAGFTVIRENERDPDRKHVEFMAVHKSTGQHVLVEAKSRHRRGVIGRPGAKQTTPDFRFQKLINAAIEKDPNNPLALFVDTNLPADRAHQFTRRNQLTQSSLRMRLRHCWTGFEKTMAGSILTIFLCCQITRSTTQKMTRSHPAITFLGTFPIRAACLFITKTLCSI